MFNRRGFAVLPVVLLLAGAFVVSVASVVLINRSSNTSAISLPVAHVEPLTKEKEKEIIEKTEVFNLLPDNVVKGNVLISRGVDASPAWGKVVLGTHTSGDYVSALKGTDHQVTVSKDTGNITISLSSELIVNNASASGTLGSGGEASLSSKLILGSTTPQINATNNRNLDLGFQNTGRIEFFNSSNYIDSAGALVVTSLSVPSATLSGTLGVGGEASLSAKLILGSATPQINATNNRNLALGFANTGRLEFLTTTNYLSSTALSLTTGSVYQINGTSVLNATTLGSGVVTSSLTTVGALASGSIASGFGNISTGNTITTTGTIGTAATTTFTGAGATLTSATISGTLGVGGNITAQGDLSVKGNTNLIIGSVYQINGTGVLSATTLGSGVTASSLTSLGTVTTGVWQGTAIGAVYGGTGQTTVTTGDLLYGSASNVWSKLADVATGNVLISGGVSTAPSWGKVTLGTHTTGNYVSSAIGTANQVNVSGATGDVTFSLPQSIATSSTPTFGGLTVSGNASVSGTLGAGGEASLSAKLTLDSATPQINATNNRNLQFGLANTGRVEFLATTNYLSSTALSLTTGSAYQINGTSVLNATTLGSGVTASSLTSVGTVATGVWNATAVGTQYGGTGQNFSATAQGNTLYFSAAGTLSALAPGTANQIFLTGGAGANPSWSNISALVSGTTNQISVSGTTALTLSTPQDIHTGASPTFGGLTVSGNATVSGTLGAGGEASLSAKLVLGSATPQINATNNRNLQLGFANTGRIEFGATTNFLSSTALSLTTGSAYQINGTSVLNATTLGTGVVTSSLTTVGALASGSIASGFGTIATANTITGTTLNGTTGINTGASGGTNRIDVSGNLVNIGSITATGTLTNTGAATVSGTLGAGGEASLSAKLTLDSATPQINATNNRNLQFGISNTGRIEFLATTNYLSSTALSLTTGSAYQINGTSVLNATTLGSGVTASSLTSLGTIATGVWNGTAIGTTYGGTGQNFGATAQGNVLYFSAAGTLAALSPGTANQVFITGGAAANPSWSNISGLLTAGTGISLSGTTNVTITNSDLGSSQNIFKNVAVSGQTTVAADANADTLTVAAGSNITITTDATTDTLTIAAAGGAAWSGITDPTTNLTLAMAANTTTFNWTDFTGNSNFFNFNFDNNGGTAGTDQGVLITNAVSTATTGDLNTEALLVLDQADTTTTGTTIVDDALLITNSGGSTLTDAIQIGTGTQAIGTGIRMGSTGITTDIVLQNAETIDNNTDGQIAFSGILTGTSGTNTRLQATGTGTGSTGTGSIYFLNSSGTTRARLDTTGASSTTGPLDATGGTITTSGGYRIHTFTSSGTFTPGSAGDVEYLVVAGGGGGGFYPGSGFGAGGGGAGGYRTATGFAVTAQGYTVTVGAGGLGSSSAQGANGSDSVFSTITSTGGGGGGRGRAAAATSTENGLNGGSGGGGGAADSGTAPTGGTATAGQGNDGKAGTANATGQNGGGGGAGGVGTTGRPSSGGVGSSSSISGSAVTYATGGGGGQTTAAAGAANTGNGGSGNEIGTSQNGSDGGSGIVIVRYPTYGTLYLGATNTTAADLAEYYVSGDPSIAAGDVVIINSSQLTINNEKGETETITTKGVLRKADKPYDSKLVGIISTNPGVVLGSIDGDTGKEDKRMLALSGRVPVKIDPDSEAIEIGDFLTSSDIHPGMAMKAVKAGYTIGKALEKWSCQKIQNTQSSGTSDQSDNQTVGSSEFSECSEKIEAFVNLGYNMGPLETVVADLTTKKSAFADLVDSASSPSGWTDNLGSILLRNQSFVKGVGNLNVTDLGVDLPGFGPGELGLSVQLSEPARPTPISLSQFLKGIVNQSASQAGILKQVQDDVATVSAVLTQDISTSLSALPQIKSDVEVLKEQMASVSARLAKVENLKMDKLDGLDPESSISGILDRIFKNSSSNDPIFQLQNIDVSTVSGQFATFSDSLKVIGKTQLAETTIGGSLSVGLLHFDDVKAEISSLTGQVTINSNLNVMGDATVSGELKVKKGIVLPDTLTGEDYCIQMTNGEIVKKKGECL